ncbi:MAG: hypothetical protein GY711_27935 [bacterium]|nr:hypothetical protein [bacterium]
MAAELDFTGPGLGIAKADVYFLFDMLAPLGCACAGIRSRCRSEMCEELS